jgi:transposase
MYTTILTLYKQGMKIRKISRTTNIHRDTIRKIIKKYEKEKIEEPINYKRESQVSKWHESKVSPMSQTKNDSKRETFFINY